MLCRRNLMKLAPSTLAAVAFVAFSSQAVHAADTCFTDSSSLTLVAKKFKLPSRNTCTSLQGQVYSYALGSMQPWVFTGSACTNAAGNMLRIAYSYFEHDADLNDHWGHMDIPLPAKKGGATFSGDSGHPGAGESDGGTEIITCEPPTVPLP